jgi:hypothetical protein
VHVKLKPANILLEKHLRELGIYTIAEFPFHPTRKWRFDYAFGDCSTRKVAFEIEGGIYTQGRHTRGKGYEEDLMKYNEAALLGWIVFRFSTGQVLRGEAKKFLQEWLRGSK